ncbi:unnamed protein product [Allacma fusca]|uniref:Uncharacterized protein n=1 Tax=Allacma fusca TaxID=39272 RepID=A0A8J2K4A3_9HEXA|nr:unnamed protein product [Allacma fusca]
MIRDETVTVCEKFANKFIRFVPFRRTELSKKLCKYSLQKKKKISNRKKNQTMALQNLHEMIRNLSSYIKSLEAVCESGVRLAKNFERLLSPGPVGQTIGGAPASSTSLDSDLLTQSVATWELAHKVATADANALISELLPLLQEAVQNAMKDPCHHSTNTYEVFRSCFSAFFQIQWRFCSLYLQCTSSQANWSAPQGMFPRTPDLARSPTTASFSSSGDRRESTESCMSSFSLPRSSISGLSALSSRSSSPSPQVHHSHHYGHHSRSRNSSPSVKFTPSQPPSPLMPYGEGAYPYLFRRWSAHTHNYNNNSSSMSSGPSASSNLSGAGSYPSSGSVSSGLSTGLSFSRRWSVPASSGTQNQASSSNSNRKTDSVDGVYDYGLLDAINLLSTKPASPIPVKILPPAEESIDEFCPLEQTTSLWPPSETMPGVVLTTCGSDAETMMNLESLQRSSHQSLRVPFSGGDTPTSGHSAASSIMTATTGQLAQPGEYSLFGNSPSPTQGS